MTTRLPEVRHKLAIALDVDDLVVASRLAKAVQPSFGVAKIGLELFSAAGPEAIGVISDLGFDVFLDVKLHDIPNTVNKAARVLGSLGVQYLTLHAHGGVDMLRAGVEGLDEGASAAGVDAPTSLAVTVLTSDGGAPAHVVPNRLAVAMEAGCAGVVCAGTDLALVRGIAPKMAKVVPGIRPLGADSHDQARTSTPEQAIADGASVLVIGRAVTAADNPSLAAAQIAASVARASDLA